MAERAKAEPAEARAEVLDVEVGPELGCLLHLHLVELLRAVVEAGFDFLQYSRHHPAELNVFEGSQK